MCRSYLTHLEDLTITGMQNGSDDDQRLTHDIMKSVHPEQKFAVSLLKSSDASADVLICSEDSHHRMNCHLYKTVVCTHHGCAPIQGLHPSPPSPFLKGTWIKAAFEGRTL